MGKFIFAALALGLCAGTAAAAGNPQAGQQKAALCAGCHGPDGNSIAMPPPSDPWPKLAGQLPEYISKQLHDFKAGRRSNTQMSPMAQQVAEADIPDIAAWFSSQQAKPAEASRKELLAKGEELFTKGKGRPAPIAACIGCHGLTGAGNTTWQQISKVPPAIIPPAIGSQHASYIEKQLRAYRDGSRSNDPGSVMRNIAKRLDDSEIAAVAEYASTLAR